MLKQWTFWGLTYIVEDIKQIAFNLFILYSILIEPLNKNFQAIPLSFIAVVNKELNY